MKRGKVTVQWPRGLHLRRAAELVRITQRFSSQVGLQLGSRMADARSVLSLMLLSASIGAALDVEASGADEHEAIQAVQEFFRDSNDG